PSAVAPIVNATSVTTPVSKTSPDQPPGPLMSARVPARAATRSAPHAAATRSFTDPSSLTNDTWLTWTRSVDSASDADSVTSTRPPPASVVTSTTTGAPSRGKVTLDVSAATGSSASGGVGVAAAVPASA